MSLSNEIFSKTWSPPGHSRHDQQSDSFETEASHRIDKADNLLVKVDRYLAAFEDDTPRTGDDEPRARTDEHLLSQSKEAHKMLSEACLLLQSERRSMFEMVAERDRFRDIILCQQQKKLLATGTNIQAAYSTLLEIQANIRQTVTVGVSEWAEDTMAKLQPHDHILPHLLAQIFMHCNALVERRLRDHVSFFSGGGNVDISTCDMDQETADFMRDHLRRHYLTLFPLKGGDLQMACEQVFNGLGEWVADQVSNWTASFAKDHVLGNSGLNRVIEQYLVVLVNTSLQHPPVVFEGDCGTEQSFDPQIHADSIDGDALRAGDKCVVVFPALSAESETAPSEPKPVNKKFVLPASSSASS